MREFGFTSGDLTGSLLIAHPSLLDPNFSKSVLFVSAHDAEEGSFGLILNRPAGRTVAEVLPGRELGALLRVPVFLGGPVGIDQLVFASFKWHSETRRMECQHHLGVEEALEIVHTDHTVLRAFIGYAGWSKGQLEGELAHRAWLVGKPTQEVLDTRRADNLWRETLKSFGPWFQLVADAPDDLSKN